MKNLTYLALSNNGLTGVIPSFLSNLTQLTQLELALNYFTGKIPPELGALTKLRIMYFHDNYLEGSIPASLSNCTELQEIDLIENRLTGEIPSELGQKLQNLQKLYLWNNRFSGKIPLTLSNLSQLILLDLSMNNLEGEVPKGFGKLKKLENLYLHGNNLVGSYGDNSLGFITALTNCSLLKKLHLGSCLFAGKIPDSIGALSKDLYYLNLLHNHITGKIPDSIGNLSSLVNIRLDYNLLSGKIPQTFGMLAKLQRLYLSTNRLLGPIPDTIGKMENLGYLDLSNNLLTGLIPKSLGGLSQLRYLYLSRNKLSGTIPIALSQCSLMMLIDLSFNSLQGSVPEEIGQFSNLAFSLNLSNNNFEGEIPLSIGNLVSVEAIDFSENKFSGLIPSSIGGCISLEYLNLSNNMIQGPIPESLKQIRYFKVLDLAYNQLTGSIPLWLANDLMIRNLNLSYNRLTGVVPENGKFSDLNRTSFIGNVGLCSRSPLMDLPPCEEKKQNHEKKKQIYYAIAAAVSCSLLLVMLIAIFTRHFFFKKRFSKLEAQNLMESPKHHGFRTFTKRELELATFGFNEDNLLGSGTFGAVYKAIIDNGKTSVAVKILHGDCSQSYKSIRQEIQILSEVRHRNLVRMVGSAWQSDLKAIVLEFIGNGSLDKHLYNGESNESCRLALKERLSIAIDIAQGLEYLHEDCPFQVVHCDLKPENVLLDNDMVAHVADFGIGKLIAGDEVKGDSTTTCFLRGSVGYIPPEYGQGAEVSVKGDVYSFGVMLLELVTRKRPVSEMFSNGLDLRKWVTSSFPNSVWDVIDISIKDEANLERRDTLNWLQNCCIQMLDAGIACTEENPQNRPPVSLVVRRLKDAWKEMRF